MNVHCISLGCQYQSKVGPGSNDGRIYRLMTLVMDGCCLWLAAFKIGSDENSRLVSGGWCWRLVWVWTRFKVTAFICSWLNLSSRKRRCQIEHSVDGTNKIKKKPIRMMHADQWICRSRQLQVAHVSAGVHFGEVEPRSAGLRRVMHDQSESWHSVTVGGNWKTLCSMPSPSGHLFIPDAEEEKVSGYAQWP